jgi:hypothetical protein
MLRHRPGIHAARAGEADAALLQLFTIELVGAGADRLDEAQPRRRVEEVVAPEAGDHDDLRFADALLEIFPRSHFEALDGRLPRKEALLHPIGGVREENRHLSSPGLQMREILGRLAPSVAQAVDVRDRNSRYLRLREPFEATDVDAIHLAHGRVVADTEGPHAADLAEESAGSSSS